MRIPKNPEEIYYYVPKKLPIVFQGAGTYYMSSMGLLLRVVSIEVLDFEMKKGTHLFYVEEKDVIK